MISTTISTHDQRVIERAHRVIILVEGAIAKDETIDYPSDHTQPVTAT